MSYPLAWLTARPVAHRGLHNSAAGIVENTVSAARAAIAKNYAIEIDVQISADGEAMVYHDDALGRLTEGSSPLASMSAADIKAVAFKATSDRIVTLAEFCEVVAGSVPLVIELKSHFNGDLRIARRAAEIVTQYRGAAALMSFDPQLIEMLRRDFPNVTRGIVAERHYDDAEYAALDDSAKQAMAHLLHAWRTRPHFVAYHVNDLPAPGPWVARHLFGLPVLTWTVRTPENVARAKRYADQMIFEGWLPE